MNCTCLWRVSQLRCSASAINLRLSREKKMADNQYDVSPKLLRLFHEKQKIREAIRQEVLRAETNPHTSNKSPYDRAITQYHSLWVYRCEHVYPTAKNISVICAMFVIPVTLVFFHCVTYQKKKEAFLRSGQRAYKDRCYKQFV